MSGSGNIILGGIEGGGSHSVVVLFDLEGNKLAELDSPISTNLWLVGMDECRDRINQLVHEAMNIAGLDPSLTLKSLGLSLSGCEDESTNEELKKSLISKYPNLSETYVVCSDTIGSIATASEHGGLVIISGTGSNSFLLNPDGSTARCGGWGYLLADEGSAFWASHTAIKMVVDEEDNRRVPPHPTDVVKAAMLDHFQIKDRFGLMEQCYSKFNKAVYAGFCAKLASGAEQGDLLCKYIFREAGRLLGEFIAALLPSIQQSLLDEGLPVICVGRVWKSFGLMKEGFIEGARSHPGPVKTDHLLHTFRLLELHTTLAVGAAYLGAKEAGIHFARDYSANAYTFFSHDETPIV